MKVRCPSCGKDADYIPQNKFRPFCSERCATLDLGAWADEKYAVPAEDQSVNENSDAESIAASEIPPKDLRN